MAGDDDRLAQAAKPMQDAMRLHRQYRGKVQVLPKCPVSAASDFAIWYTPGVAAPCRAIQADRKLVYDYTNKGNSIAIVSDGSRVLGLGNIGPEAGLPVMEGKALLFKYLGGVDAVPICLKTQEPDDIVRAVEWLQPSFGGINLEDIAQPKCFRVLDELRRRCTIPVWHDDQQGSATVLLAGLINALRVVGKDMRTVRVTLVGIGAANFATYRLLKSYGVDPGRIIACDTAGALHRGRADIESQQAAFAEKWQVCLESNADNVRGGGLSVFIVDMREAKGLTIKPIRTMMNHGTTEIFFDDLLVPAENLIGVEGKGFRYILDGMNAERTLIAAECIGDARWFIEKATAYAKERRVFDRPIGQNQGVQFPIARAYAATEAAALMVEKSTRLFDAGDTNGEVANLAKLLAADASWQAADMCVQVHGGFGFAEEFDVERKFREARLYQVAPISTNLILSYVAEHVLGLPRSY